MSKNIGTTDRGIRVVLGLALIAYAIPVGFPDTGWNWVGWIGIIPLLTALLGMCPLYSVIGISTCKR
jgi:hypothetical protein